MTAMAYDGIPPVTMVMMNMIMIYRRLIMIQSILIYSDYDQFRIAMTIKHTTT